MNIWRRLAISLLIPMAGGCGLGGKFLCIAPPVPFPSEIVPCNDIKDCIAKDSECRIANSCQKNICVFVIADAGTVLTEQVLGDCKQYICDGKGLTQEVELDTDIADDGNPCTMDTCKGGEPEHLLQVGAEVSCYTGPELTKSVGICKGGMAACEPNGMPGLTCTGEVLPGKEICDLAALDEDCDGEVNEEGENCVCGDGFRSNQEACDDGNQDQTDECKNDCTLPKCGDGIVQEVVGETCDDGGVADGDICSPQCKEQRVLSICAGENYSCALVSGGRVKCWGNNNSGQLGSGIFGNKGDQLNEMGVNLLPVDLGTGVIVNSISCGRKHVCALLDNAQIKCWGSNSFGKLGLGTFDKVGVLAGDNLPVVDLGTGTTVIAVSAGGNHTCALLGDGNIKCWGYNNYGQLGLGDTIARGQQPADMGDNLPSVNLGTSKTAVAIGVGENHTCAVLNDGTVKCWGRATSGALGFFVAYGSHGGLLTDMGDSLPSVELGMGKIAKAVAVSDQWSCALLTDETVKCWGQNNVGQLGQGDTKDRGDQPTDMGDNLLPVGVGIGRTVKSVRAGSAHACVLLDDASTKCWGVNSNAQLGQNYPNTIGDASNEMGDSLIPILLSTSWTTTAVASGYSHSCALLNNERIKCWGGNQDGQLGLGHTLTWGDNPAEMGDNLPFVNLFSSVW